LVYGAGDNGGVGDWRNGVEYRATSGSGEDRSNFRSCGKGLLEIHNQEIKGIKDITRDLGPEFQKMIKVVSEVITDYKHIKQTMKDWV
jgi:hypothetical protein